MQDPASDPRWFQPLVRSVLRWGPVRAAAVLSLAVCAFSNAITQAVITVAGQGNRPLAAFSASVCSLLVTPAVSWVVFSLVCRLEAARAQLAVLATQDNLTGVLNRRHFMVLAEREWARCRRYETDAAMLLIDADHFKRVNETHGQLCGDALLREIVRISAGSLRQADLLARFGGEELVVMLPHTDPLGALDVAERIREKVSAFRLEWRGGKAGTTVSIGVASLGASHASLDQLIQEADTALYAAKEAGRNCVRAAPIQPRRSGETTPVISK